MKPKCLGLLLFYKFYEGGGMVFFAGIGGYLSVLSMSGEKCGQLGKAVVGYGNKRAEVEFVIPSLMACYCGCGYQRVFWS